MRKEDFPISAEGVKKLEAELEKHPEINISDDKGAVYVNLSMVRLQLAWVMPKLIYAKGIADEKGYRIYAICWRENELFEELLGSMGIKLLCLEKLIRSDICGGIKAALKTVGFMLFDGTGTGLQRFRYCGVNAGKYLYEDILRTSSLSTMVNARNKICFKKMLHILWMCSSLERFLKKHHPVYMVADDLAYHEAILLSLFKKNGAEIRNVSVGMEEDILFNKRGEAIRRGECLHRRIAAQLKKGNTSEDALKLLDGYFKGEGGRILDRGAFRDKQVKDRDQLCKELGFDINKKNIVIMAHTFTDAVLNYGDLYFRDYYDWLDKTLSIAEQTDNVNWILKPHPTRGAYNEAEDSIEDMFERHKKPHMFFLPDDVSTESIKYLADVIITIGGNAGAEFACLGIKPVIVGKPYYHGFGYTEEPASLDAYEKVLRNIAELPALDDEQTAMARTVFSLKNNDAKSDMAFKDDLATKLSGLYTKMLDKMAVDYFQSNEGTMEYNDMVCAFLTDHFKEHDISECEYYSRGKLRGQVL